jgi:hypothetical protein
MYRWPPCHVWLGYSHKYFKGNQVDKHELKFNQKLYGVVSNLCAQSHPSTRFSETTLHNLHGDVHNQKSLISYKYGRFYFKLLLD